MILEICANSIESAIIAQRAGAHRIELCANLEIGGITPSYATISLTKQLLKIPVYVLIRPRAGDFLYSQVEYDTIQKDIGLCKDLGCEGVVIGLLQRDGHIDKERTAELVQLAKPMGVTFHRAFDCCRDPFEALENIIDCGCERLLTSGQESNATKGADLLAQLVEQAGERIAIMPGAGINKDNIALLMEQTRAREFHCSAKESMHSEMAYLNAKLSDMGPQPSLSNEEEIRAVLDIMNKKSGKP